MKTVLIDIREIKKYYDVRTEILAAKRDAVRAVDGVSLKIFRGETLGLVGESGCGKSTLARLLLRLETPTHGTILFEDRDIFKFKDKDLRTYRRNVQIIFQDPYASLNPRRNAGSTIGEPLLVNNINNREGRAVEVLRIMNVVGLTEEQKDRYPHEFSGGQRQRIGIARAIIMKPQLIVADEPVSALDVSIQAQILNLLKELQNEFNLTYMFISHDLSVVRHVSDRIAVMHLGRIVEMANNSELYEHPLHPYTIELLAAIPSPDPSKKKERAEREMRWNDGSTGKCAFYPRCREKLDACDREEPELIDVGDGHYVACHRATQTPLL
ncbi:MAG TPA: oligopeptide/dipeptide ABC transporter ATP-binding protein [Syntrophales bacterium]|nr:oligopeptide/dipeptide ABC transporter ATP-binding protein [Syntrophales bacterium]